MLIQKRKMPSLSVFIFPLLLSLSLTTACSKIGADQVAVDLALVRIKSGELVRDVEKTINQLPTVAFSNPSSSAPSAQAVGDPCPEVGQPPADASDEEMSDALTEFASCIHAQYYPAHVAASAIEYFKVFRMDESERPLSTMADSELLEYVKERFSDPLLLLGASDPDLAAQAAKLRGSFSDAELGELLILVSRRHDALVQGEARLFAAMDARKELLSHFAARINRYELLQVLRETAGDPTGVETAGKIIPILQRARMQVPAEMDSFPVGMLHPFAAMAALPDVGMELQSLDRKNENPFLSIARTLAELGGSADLVKKTIDLYTDIRNRDNPMIPPHEAPAVDAVRVAFIDSGIDYVTHPDLGLFLGQGVGDQISSGDYADGDVSPWLPAVGGFGHGSGTSATLLTIMAHYAPETLRERKLDLAMWKVGSIRDLLAGPGEGYGRWESHAALHEAIIKRIEGQEVKPKIVSVSIGFTFQGGAQGIGREGVLLNAPWLWVMAAGNSGIDVHDEHYKTCFDDVPVDQRVDARILCVGAMIPGIVNDRIANYSNFGDRVDVYAFESYIGLCPNGTSCATPAVSGAAAVIAAKFPSLSPEQIKRAIVAASEEKTLEIDYGDDEQAAMMAMVRGESNFRQVKVFNPPAMLPRALEIARSMAQFGVDPAGGDFLTAVPLTVRR